MRVVICCKRFRPSGGAEGFLKELASALAGTGHAVKVLTPDPGAESEGVEIARLRLPPLPRAIRCVALARAARDALAAERADVTFSDQRCWGARVVRAGGGVHREYLAQIEKSCRTLAGLALRRVRLALSLRERCHLLVEDRLFSPPGPELVIANSKMVRRQLLQRYPHLADRVQVVYNGVDLERFHPRLRDEHRRAVRERLGIPFEALALVFVGTGWRRKGLRTCIDALGILAGKGTRPPVHAIVVGAGDRRAVRRQAAAWSVAERVHFVGLAPPEPYYGAADLAALPSYYDACANVTFEALACGLPVVTSLSNGAHEVLTPGVDGFCLSDAGDSAQLAGFIEHFMSGDRLTAASRAARRLAERFPAARQLGAIVSLLEGLA